MRRFEIAIAIIVIAALLAVAGTFVWPMLSALSRSEGGLAPAIVMIVGCFALGGALMFLLFFSARRGHDEAVYRGDRDPSDDSASSWRRQSPHHHRKR